MSASGSSDPTVLPLRVRLARKDGPSLEQEFSETFRVGRSSECQLILDAPTVSKAHVEFRRDGGQWLVLDLESRNGVYLDGTRVQRASLPPHATITLGYGGPALEVTIDTPPPSTTTATTSSSQDVSVTRLVERFTQRRPQGEMGEHTRIFHEAVTRVATRKSRRYQWLLLAFVVLLGAAGWVLYEQEQRLQAMRSTAGDMFYSMKRLELQVAQLEEAVQQGKELEELAAKRRALQDLEAQYDKFIKEQSLFDPALSAQDRAVFRVARMFGECDATMPKEFLAEVKKYVAMWRGTERFTRSLRRAKELGVVQLVQDHMGRRNLPPQFLYLAMQESGFDAKAIGPKTRFGHAKGMWQFIAPTAQEYGLRTGPLADRPEYDPEDDRFDYGKATEAAARYIKRLYLTDAQASGLLVMASYNWGEGHVLKIIRQMPQNPRDRNFWKLLKQASIPKETYDYVFSIVAATVIGENPQLFGLDLKNPFQVT